ncbi:MAG: hypothetical protein ACK55I_23945, partial [bacterium]
MLEDRSGSLAEPAVELAHRRPDQERAGPAGEFFREQLGALAAVEVLREVHRPGKIGQELAGLGLQQLPEAPEMGVLQREQCEVLPVGVVRHARDVRDPGRGMRSRKGQGFCEHRLTACEQLDAGIARACALPQVTGQFELESPRFRRSPA